MTQPDLPSQWEQFKATRLTSQPLARAVAAWSVTATGLVIPNDPASIATAKRISYTWRTIYGAPLPYTLAPNGPAPSAPPPAPPPATYQARLPGFPDLTQNWTQTPDFFFDVVIPTANPTTVKLIAAIIRKTIGQRDKRGQWSQWWIGVSYATISQATGINSRTSIEQAITQARASGWIKRRANGPQRFDYALRWDDEPVDNWPQTGDN